MTKGGNNDSYINVNLSESTSARCNPTFVLHISHHWILHPVTKFFKNIEIKRACTWNA
jgi:hypothetical protein